MFTTKTIIGMALGALAMLQPAMALQPRSWVSAKGNDANPCTELQPCRTFQKAHDATAMGGEVNVLDPAEYGPVKVDRSITIDGGNMGYIQPPLQTDGIFINNASAQVVVRNLSLLGFSSVDSAADGIRAQNARGLSVDHVQIKGFAHGVTVAFANRLPVRVLVADTIIRLCGAGILVLGDLRNELASWMTLVVDNVTIEGGVDGISLAATRATVTRSSISECTNAGIFGNQAEVNLSDLTVAFNNRALTTSGNSLFRVATSNIHDNGLAFLNAGGPILSFGNNQVAGNGGNETPTSTLTLK